MTRGKRTRKLILMNPGPVNVTEGVRRSLLGPDLCHREKEFKALFGQTKNKLLKVFGIQNTHEAALFTGSGTLAVEAMLSSYGGPGKKVLVLSNGVYGERIEQILNIHRVSMRKLETPLASFPSTKDIENVLQRDGAITAVAVVHHETSTGMLNPLPEIGRLVKKYNKTFLVDAVSSLGAEKVDFNRWGIDFCAGSSGKCLHGLPGLSFVLVSKKEARRLAENKAGTVYMDLAMTLKAARSGEPPFTPAVQLYYAFNQALNELLRQGLDRRIADYAKKMSILETGLAELGVRFVVEKKYRSHVLLASYLPNGISYETLHDNLKKKGFVIYAGQSSMKKSIFRVSALGDIRESDLVRFLNEFKKITGKAPIAPKAIVLAAGVGKRFGSRTKLLPKCLIPLDRSGQTLLSRYFDAFRDNHIKKIVIVYGHKKEKIAAACKKYGTGLDIELIENKEYRKGSVLSLYTAAAHLDDDVLIMDADVFFSSEALSRLLACGNKSAFLLDKNSKSSGEEMMLQSRGGKPVSIAKKLDPRLKPVGEATGIVKLARADAKILRSILTEFYKKGNVYVEYEDAYCDLLKKRSLGSVTMDGIFWTEMDFEEDLKKISDYLNLAR